MEKRSVSANGIESDLCVSHARDLVARGLDDLGHGFDVGAVDRHDLLGICFEDVSRPERTIDVRTEVLKCGSQAAVKHMYAGENRPECHRGNSAEYFPEIASISGEGARRATAGLQ